MANPTKVQRTQTLGHYDHIDGRLVRMGAFHDFAQVEQVFSSYKDVPSDTHFILQVSFPAQGDHWVGVELLGNYTRVRDLMKVIYNQPELAQKYPQCIGDGQELPDLFAQRDLNGRILEKSFSSYVQVKCYLKYLGVKKDAIFTARFQFPAQNGDEVNVEIKGNLDRVSKILELVYLHPKELAKDYPVSQPSKYQEIPEFVDTDWE